MTAGLTAINTKKRTPFAEKGAQVHHCVGHTGKIFRVSSFNPLHLNNVRDIISSKCSLINWTLSDELYDWFTRPAKRGVTNSTTDSRLVKRRVNISAIIRLQKWD